jgi:hypothetical protein
MKRLILISITLTFLWLAPTIDAQIVAEAYLDFGKNQVSEGLYSKVSNIGIFEKQKWGVQAGYQLGLVNTPGLVFNSWNGSSYLKFNLGKLPMVLGGEYLWTAFSPDLRETNWIIFAGTTLNHWRLGLGNGIRTYRLSYSAARDAELSDSQEKIIEKWNMIYHLTYALKPLENKWNLSFTLTDYDRFIIQQENNFMYNLRFDYKLSRPLSIYSELWYKSAGLMVIKVTYFGIFLRVGVLWNI